MADDIITIDGSMGEGGGQILRAALALSMTLGRPFRLENIRANREKPGLRRQHLLCVQAARELCGAKVAGDELGALSLEFAPGPVRPGDYRFAVGTGGSVTLVLQALVPALLFAGAASRLTVTGGTHVPFAPPFEFMRDTLFPQLERLGPKLSAAMKRIGYMEVGGGRVEVEIVPAPPKPLPLETEQGEFAGAFALIYGHNLPPSVTEREIAVLLEERYAALGLGTDRITVLDKSDPACPAEGGGNMVMVGLRCGGNLTIFGECGWRGRTAEKVAGEAAKRALEFLRSGAPVEAHLADQLLVPLALAGGGGFVTQRLTKHTETCLKVVELFTGIRAEITRMAGQRVQISLPPM